ncbi:MAG: methyltransferase family protein [Chitinophagaceae bacterium]
MLLRMYLPVFILMYLMVTFVLPIWRVYKTSGINPVTFGKTDNAHDYIGKLMKLLVLLLVAAVLIYAYMPQFYRHLVPLAYFESEGFRIAGLALIHVSLVWLVAAQYQMQQSWRIGIDENNKTALVTGGLFSLSRNPVFLGMILSVLGLFLILPNTLMLMVLITTYIVIQIQIRLEEQFLTQLHGVAYSRYRQRVRRMI